MAKTKHPTSFTVQIYRSDYSSLPREKRVPHILEPRYYLLSPDAQIGRNDDNPLDEGWKNLSEYHIGNDFFIGENRWIKAMRSLIKSRMWDIVIAMLIEDIANSMKKEYAIFWVNRVSIEDRQTARKILEVFSIHQKNYDDMVKKLSTTIIREFGFQPKIYEPKALMKYKEDTIFDIWFFVLPDAEKNKIRFVISEEYYSFTSFAKSYCYPIHATPSSPELFVIVEQFDRIGEKDRFYKWIEESLESHFIAQRSYRKDSYYDTYIMVKDELEMKLALHDFCDIVLNILSHNQREFLTNIIRTISGVFTQVLITGPLYSIQSN